MDENDTFCEVLEAFQDGLGKGMPIHDIQAEIKDTYKDCVDSCIAELAIAEALWRLGALTEDNLNNVIQIVDSGADCEYWRKLGADEHFIRSRRLELARFEKRLSCPANPKQRWRIPQPEEKLKKGTAFWYKSHGNIYGAVVLEVQGDEVENYLIAISEHLDAVPQEVSHILASQIYTAAWFSRINLLAPKRMHRMGEIPIQKNYINKFGIYIDYHRSVSITNCGQAQTWSHSFRQMSFHCALIDNFV